MSEGQFTPANELEQVLMRAANDPSARPEFYRRLLDADLFFLTPDLPEISGRHTLERDTQVKLSYWQGQNGTFLPIFSSEQLLQAAVKRTGQTYGVLGMKGKNAFEILAQNPMQTILNPGFAYGKEFVPQEIKDLADGGLFKGNPRVVTKDKQILLGQPSVYPQALVAMLQKLLGERPSVVGAYLAQMHDPSSGDPPHLLIGVECEGDFRPISSDIGIAIRGSGTLGEGKFADVIQLGSGNDSLDSYFKKQTKPFYQRTAAKLFRKFW